MVFFGRTPCHALSYVINGLLRRYVYKRVAIRNFASLINKRMKGTLTREVGAIRGDRVSVGVLPVATNIPEKPAASAQLVQVQPPWNKTSL